MYNFIDRRDRRSVTIKMEDADESDAGAFLAQVTKLTKRHAKKVIGN